ncbi:TIGR01777 family oxidoreductase [Spongiactinospora sp. TRM90649]|uniref:TIGR01777 family oxidoreductase n=1 Tax=Spongiactinospora sp. TRM90649 TaxID=3031114 RepID=UPI0023F8AA70|nr:TIGR01777 family oxidoreductase [Spongiactinospora sp. TRM90649]MDF5755631.1 TIGR01777 family oxidoreductase [Spongiactinospora sp. TRM90649]
MTIILTGASGLLGSALGAALRDDGHRVVRLVRRAAQGQDESFWNPAEGLIDPGALEGARAVVHLAGAGIGDRRWTDAYKREIVRSRVEGTRTLVDALSGLNRKPERLLSASGIHFYGDTGDRIVDESDPAGQGFLPDLVVRWEAEAQRAAAAGIGVTTLRSGLVLSASGGSLARMLPVFKLGLGAPMGSGRQFWSWVSLEDWVGSVRYILQKPEITGPVNVTSPNPVNNVDFTRSLAKALRRPTLPLGVPPVALRLALGGFADEGILAGPRAIPRRLTESGYLFRHKSINEAFSAIL